MTSKNITVEEFDRRFDNGEDVSDFLDLANATRPGLAPQQVAIDFPAWMVHSVDKEAAKIGIDRQSLIKVWIADKLKSLANEA